MKIEFIAHAGFRLFNGEDEVIIDPWLKSSNIQTPILESFKSSHHTIDFLRPKPKIRPTELSPNLILISHFHAHHSSSKDLLEIAGQNKSQIKLIGPKSSTNSLVDNYQKYFDCVFIDNDETFYFNNYKISIFTHTSENHLGFFIEDTLTETSFMHIADAVINRSYYDRRIDPIWFKLNNIRPTFLALTSGATSSAIYVNDIEDKITFSENYSGNEGWRPSFIENSMMSPTECARLANEIKPKIVCLMGMYNFSIWKQDIEYSFSAYESENYFSWALSHINSNIITFPLRPRLVIDLAKFKCGDSYVKY